MCAPNEIDVKVFQTLNIYYIAFETNYIINYLATNHIFEVLVYWKSLCSDWVLQYMNSLYISICIYSSLACTSNMHKPDACCWMSIHKQRQVVDMEWERERERVMVCGWLWFDVDELCGGLSSYIFVFVFAQRRLCLPLYYSSLEATRFV